MKFCAMFIAGQVSKNIVLHKSLTWCKVLSILQIMVNDSIQNPKAPLYESILDDLEEILIELDLAISLNDPNKLSNAADHMLGFVEISLQYQDPLLYEAQHDLRGAITIIHSRLELLRNLTVGTHEHDECLRKLCANVDNARTILRFVRDSLMNERTISPVRLGSNIYSLREVFASYALGREWKEKTDDRYEFGERSFKVRSDVRLIAKANWAAVARATLNLVSNAGAHNPEGPLRVELSVCSPEMNPSVVEIHVRDSGKGIDDPEKAFERGWTTNDLRGGTGLGLYIVKSAIYSCGGTVLLDGHGGFDGGAHFTLSFPRVANRERLGISRSSQ